MKKLVAILLAALLALSCCASAEELPKIRFRDFEWRSPVLPVVEDVLTDDFYIFGNPRGLNIQDSGDRLAPVMLGVEQKTEIASSAGTELPYEAGYTINVFPWTDSFSVAGYDVFQITLYSLIHCEDGVCDTDINVSELYKAEYTISISDKNGLEFETVYTDLLTKLTALYGLFELNEDDGVCTWNGADGNTLTLSYDVVSETEIRMHIDYLFAGFDEMVEAVNEAIEANSAALMDTEGL